MLQEWKKQLQDRVGDLFDSHGDRSREREAHDRREAQLERKVGQLVIEMLPDKAGFRGRHNLGRSHEKYGWS